MNAKEALEISKLGSEAWQAEKAVILGLIKSAAAQGRRMTVIGHSRDPTIRRWLESLGYIYFPCATFGGLKAEVSW